MGAGDRDSLPVIISGTGPAALLLAHALLRATPPLPFRLYERDGSMSHRTQGYRFTVTGRGVKSCRDVLSPEHYALLRATCADNPEKIPKRVEALSGAQLPSFGGFKPTKDKIEEPLKVDRTVMRQVLFRGLEDYTSFGKEIVGYENVAAGDGSHDLKSSGDSPGVLVRFADGSTARGALLVGADGIFSRVRAQLTPASRLLNTEMLMVYSKTPLTPSFYAALGASGADDPRAVELLETLTLVADPAPQDSAMFFMFDPMRFGRRESAAATDAEVAACIPRDYIYWAVSLRNDRSEVEGLDWRSLSASATADLTLKLTENWHPSLRAIVTHQDRAETMSLRSAVVPAPVLDWRTSGPEPASAAEDVVNGSTTSESSTSGSDHQDKAAVAPMVTLIGDAAHAMPPSGGAGAQTALTDAAVLGAALATHGVSRRALEIYESEMRDYAGQAIVKSLEGGKMLLSMRDVTQMKPFVH